MFWQAIVSPMILWKNKIIGAYEELLDYALVSTMFTNSLDIITSR